MSADTPDRDPGLELLEKLEDGSGGPEAERRARQEDPASYLVHLHMAHGRARAGADRVWQRLVEARAKAPAVPLSAPKAVPPAAPWMRAPRPAVFAALAALAVLLIVIGRGRGRAGLELAVAATGPATIERAAASRGAGLAAGDRIQVPAGSRAQLAAGSLVQVALKEGAHLGVTALAADAAGSLTTLALSQDAGRAIYSVEPGAGLSVSIATPHATVRVIGTRFRVDVDAERTRVDVGEGTVEVSARAGDAAPRAVRVGIGRSLSVRSGEAPGEPAAFNRIVDPDLGSGVTPIIGQGN